MKKGQKNNILLKAILSIVTVCFFHIIYSFLAGGLYFTIVFRDLGIAIYLLMIYNLVLIWKNF